MLRIFTVHLLSSGKCVKSHVCFMTVVIYFYDLCLSGYSQVCHAAILGADSFCQFYAYKWVHQFSVRTNFWFFLNIEYYFEFDPILPKKMFHWEKGAWAGALFFAFVFCVCLNKTIILEGGFCSSVSLHSTYWNEKWKMAIAQYLHIP